MRISKGIMKEVIEIWIKVETTIDDLLLEYDVKRIIGYEDGMAYVELNSPKKINKNGIK